NPSYLPPDYHYQCGRATEGEALAVYWNKPVKRQELDRNFAESHKGAIIEVMQSEPQIKNGTAEVLSQYNSIPQFRPKLIDLGYGNVAWAHEVINDLLPARLRTYSNDGYAMHLEGYVPLD